jgi:KaiC/GvpD/RAD55 family RecA-like ATPase
MKHIPSGIPGLDELLEGGFPNPASILLTGPTGTGKSVFGLQYLYFGAKEYKEPGFMIRTEGYSTDFQWYAERFGWDVSEQQKKGMLLFSAYDPIDFEKFDLRTLHSEIIMQLARVIDQVGIKRVVIDSTTPIGYYINDRGKFRTTLYYISKALKERGCTTIFIAEKSGNSLTPFDVEPYIMDGVIELATIVREESTMQTLTLRKMISTPVPQTPLVLDFSDAGISISQAYY